MSKTVDLLVINNAPAFYKINLYNKLSKDIDLHVVFVGNTDQVVSKELTSNTIEFSYQVIFSSNQELGKRNKVISFINLYRIVKNTNYKKIIFGSYDMIELLFLIFMIPSSKNCLQLESTIIETNLNGFYFWLKKIIFGRFSYVLPAGSLHNEILKKLNYKGKSRIVNGVGLLNSGVRTISFNRICDSEYRFLYIGRLIEVKNLEFLIKVFNSNGHKLTIVGQGVLDLHLKEIANDNIKFLGYIENSILRNIFNENDILILPSFSETWGLVVEEAIYFGLPVIVSNKVGCGLDLVEQFTTGVIFKHDCEESLNNAINNMIKNYNKYKFNCVNFDFCKKDSDQINCYINLLDK
jgi:glycosyltransferase involved in cell wall biosynthesis